jgi:glycerol kinase
VILAIDQGTTGTTCLVVDDELRVRGRGHVELAASFPRPGWVEQDPEELWASVGAAAEAALADAGVRARDLRAVGIANQRETTLLWERASGRPLHRAIVWQDRRTAERCRELPFELIRGRTGLTPDPYFSATKLEWLLAEAGRRDGLAFGTVDTWLAWNLTRGEAHVTDASNASRTLLVALESLDWDGELLDLFGVPRELLPEIHASSEVVGEAELLGARVPLAALAGDQQAALAGHACFRPGETKATYGTGSFLLAHSGADCSTAPDGLLRTAAATRSGERAYALEGSVFVTGAAIQWLRDGLGVLADAAESEALAASLDGNGGV